MGSYTPNPYRAREQGRGQGGGRGRGGYLVFIIIKEVVDKVGCLKKKKIRLSKGKKIENPPTLYSI